MRNGHCRETAHFHVDQGILKQFLAPSLMRNDDVAHLQELLHSHTVFDDGMVRSCETGKCVTAERLLNDCCLHQVREISNRQIYGTVSQGSFKVDRFDDDRSDRCPGRLRGYCWDETRQKKHLADIRSRHNERSVVFAWVKRRGTNDLLLQYHE